VGWEGGRGGMGGRLAENVRRKRGWLCEQTHRREVSWFGGDRLDITLKLPTRLGDVDTR
jgi:hypothetical protein